MARRYFLAFHIFTSCLVAGRSPMYALVGMEVHLKADIPGRPDDMLWKHKGNKVVEFDGKEQHVYNPYENRITLNWISAQLDITDLRFEDSGDYELEATINNNLYTSNSLLEVIDRVSKPSISCIMDNGNNANISGKLVCSAEPQSLMQFEWRSHGSGQPGQQLTISLGEELDEEEYSCTVRNPLSSETATFTAKDCYPDKSSSAALTASLITIILIILLLVVLVLVFYKRIQKACFAEGKRDDLENHSPPGTTKVSCTKAAQSDEKNPLLSRGGNMSPNKNDGEDVDSDLDTVKDEGPDRETDEDRKAQSAPASAETSPSAQPPSLLTKRSPNLTPTAAAGELDEESEEEEEQSSTVPEQKGSATSVHKKDSEKLSEGETGEGSQQESDNRVSEDQHDSERVGVKEIQKEQPLATTQQPQSPTPTKPHNRNTSTLQESPDAAHADPHREEEGSRGSRHDSDESEGQSHSSTAADKGPDKETDEDKKAQSAPASAETSPSAQPPSLLTKSSPNLTPTYAAGELEEESEEDEEQSSSVPEQKGSGKEIQKEQPLATTQQPQSPTPTKPHNRNTSTLQESPDAAHADPHREEEGSRGSRVSHTADADKGEGETVEN